MSDSFMPFSIFLVHSGALAFEKLVELYELQRQHKEPFGRIALRSRRLTVKQSVQILSHQGDHPDERFGEIAVSMDFLTMEDVEDILKEQRLKTPQIETLAIQQGLITAEALDIWRRAYDLERRSKAA